MGNNEIGPRWSTYNDYLVSLLEGKYVIDIGAGDGNLLLRINGIGVDPYPPPYALPSVKQARAEDYLKTLQSESFDAAAGDATHSEKGG
ncbi:MAG: hypothetical protein QXP42_03965 [Candidatus Micrarchaeia archaeon]